MADCDLTDEEKRALLIGDVARLHRLGASGFLLLILARFQIFGLELETYNRRMRGVEIPQE